MIINLSGGLDSATLLAHALDVLPSETIQPITFSYGQRHNREVEAANFLAAHYRLKSRGRVNPIIKSTLPLLHSGSALTDKSREVPPLSEVVGHPQPPTYVPFRNLIFASFSLHIAEALGHNKVALGVHKSDMYGYWDTSTEFILALESLTSLNRQTQIRLWCPFMSKTKADIVQLGLDLGVPYHWTWSCYRGEKQPCHVCATCREREAAFELCGVTDPLLDVEISHE